MAEKQCENCGLKLKKKSDEIISGYDGDNRNRAKLFRCKKCGCYYIKEYQVLFFSFFL